MGQLVASHIGYFFYIKNEIYLNHLPQVAPYSVTIPGGVKISTVFQVEDRRPLPRVFSRN